MVHPCATFKSFFVGTGETKPQTVLRLCNKEANGSRPSQLLLFRVTRQGSRMFFFQEVQLLHNPNRPVRQFGISVDTAEI
jgi:hypothetical protein